MPFLLSTLDLDITPPVGHPCMGGGIPPVRSVDDPLFARGIALWGECDPIVLVALDWCEVRNTARDLWRELLAEAAHTVPERVLLASVHQHDAPVADLVAERFLRDSPEASASVCDPAFVEATARRAAEALRRAMASPRRVDGVGAGRGRVERVASNRRYEYEPGRFAFDRTSSTPNPLAHAAPEGLVDPWMRTLAFFEGESPVAELHAYAVHPMAFYGRGAVSADFPGLARARRQAERPETFQIYFSGCSGDVVAGKYNDGSPGNRSILADRLRAGMDAAAADAAARRRPLARAELRIAKLDLPPREGPGFSEEELLRETRDAARPFDRCLAAMGLSALERRRAGRAIDVPALDLGGPGFLLLPGESYVAYQLAANEIARGGAPDASELLVAGYGECDTGYVPTERAREERDSNLGDWCWVGPGSEPRMLAAIREALGAGNR